MADVTVLFGGLVVGAVSYLVSRRAAQTFRDFDSKRYPAFVYRAVNPGELGIPVFTYHSVAGPSTPDSVTPAAFERHMCHLSANGYYTLSADELHAYLVRGEPVPPKSVVITFDDGRATLWTAAYPILKRYGLRAVCFLVPGFMSESGMRSGPDGSTEADLSDVPALTWDEVRAMHDDGLVDFQSHTLDHTRIFCGPEIRDFIHPAFVFGYHNVSVPVMRVQGTDRLHDRPPLGTPIYRSQPRMSAARRFFDDEGLRNACVEYVAEQGGAAFFARSGWRADLRRYVDAYRRAHDLNERFETPDEQADAIQHSLVRSKQIIEEHLPGHTVRHLCYPWHRYSVLAASLTREAGYISAFIDINPQKPRPNPNNPYSVQRVLPLNEVGDDPYQITRIDARDDVVMSLPGAGRLSYGRRVAARFLRAPGFLKD
jgi:peptidoglycan/xylan/chitin deacetylase (PgdA/CDA1 family)